MTQNMPQKQKTKLVPVLREPALLTERDADKSPVLECIDLGITFGGLKAVDNFNVTIGRTEISGLIGPNGAGKTTVFNLLTKVYQPTHGTILLNGKDIHDLSTAQVNRAGIARTFQNIRLFGELSVEDNITVAMDNQMHYTMPEGISVCPASGRKSASCTSAQWSFSPSSTWSTSPMPRQARCPTVRSAALRSCARWRPTRAFCCSTSLPPA